MASVIHGVHGPMIHLQGLGPCSAKPASEFKVGDVTRWNYGFARDIDGYTVMQVEQISAKFVALTLRHNGSGTVYEPRRLKADRLVACFRRGDNRWGSRSHHLVQQRFEFTIVRYWVDHRLELLE